MGGTYSTNKEQKKACRVLFRKLERKRPLGRPRHKWVDTIKLDLVEIGFGVDWIDLAQNKDKWAAVVNAVMNLRVPYSAVKASSGPHTQHYCTSLQCCGKQLCP
jgi:hypothetical protein